MAALKSLWYKHEKVNNSSQARASDSIHAVVTLWSCSLSVNNDDGNINRRQTSHNTVDSILKVMGIHHAMLVAGRIQGCLVAD
jgi:hypothetical protein